MCAWKRGTQNNQPGQIRKGHIREYLAHAAAKKEAIIGKLHVLDAEHFIQIFGEDCLYNASALVCSEKNGLPEVFHQFVLNNILYLHAHEYPRCVLTAVVSEEVPYGSIILNHAQRINNKVCTAEHQQWSVFRGDAAMYDCREASIGDHRIHINSKPPPTLMSIIMEVQCADPALLAIGRVNRQIESVTEINCAVLANKFAHTLFQNIVTVDDVFLIPMRCSSNKDIIDIAGRVVEVRTQHDDESEEGSDLFKDIESVDIYRGLIDEYTAVYLKLTPVQLEVQSSKHCRSEIIFVNVKEPPPARTQRDIVHIHTNDGEYFPVKRRLLQPCIALTAVVQEGKGKYKSIHDNHNEMNTTACEDVTSASVDVDACMFDRVLLYLEHAARGDDFRFDPLLANELREAAVNLGVIGLKDTCDKVLGSFQERVRKTPIRFNEVMSRNGLDQSSINGDAVLAKRSETWLIMSGMVLDITRWLDEHPGGSTIIPEQALGVDCTIFFEIYHASRQSFLYLKEFYIGELALEDRDKVPLPSASHRETSGSSSSDGRASDAFMEQLQRVTAPWRLNIHDLNSFEVHKSF